MSQLSPFQCVILDKFEGVLSGDFLDLRRYADEHDICVLLQLSACDVLVVESDDVDRDGGLARSCVSPAREPMGAGLCGRLRAGELDMIVVRYELGSYLHCASVEFDDGRPWQLPARKRELLERRYSDCEVCRAVRGGDDDLARMLMYTRLSGGSVPGAVVTLS